MSNPIKILLLEDNADDITFIQYELKNSAMIVDLKIVQTRETYIESINLFKPDLILSDYSLPAFDGLSAFYIKEQVMPEVPFIIVSGVVGEENAVQLIKSGVTDFVLKKNLLPLISKIHRALKEAEELKLKRISAEMVKSQNEKLFEIAFLQSRQVQEPVKNIMGLLKLIDFDKPDSVSNLELIHTIGIKTIELDASILQIVRKTEEIIKI